MARRWAISRRLSRTSPSSARPITSIGRSGAGVSTVRKESPTMAAQHYEAVVIGAGQAGVPLSQALARSGRRTALIEREHVGGTCINEGCTPTKTMVASAKTAYVDRRSADYGVHNGSVAVDMPEVRGRKRAMVDSFRNSNLRRIEATDGLDLSAGDRVRHRVVARCRGAHTGSAARGDHALRHLARHRRPRARRRRSGIQLDVGALLAPGGAALAS